MGGSAGRPAHQISGDSSHLNPALRSPQAALSGPGHSAAGPRRAAGSIGPPAAVGGGAAVPGGEVDDAAIIDETCLG